jgi:hypothetical protein
MHPKQLDIKLRALNFNTSITRMYARVCACLFAMTHLRSDSQSQVRPSGGILYGCGLVTQKYVMWCTQTRQGTQNGVIMHASNRGNSNSGGAVHPNGAVLINHALMNMQGRSISPIGRANGAAAGGVHHAWCLWRWRDGQWIAG